MKNDKKPILPDVVTIKKTCELLECSRTEFYVKHFHNLHSFKDKNNYRTLFFLKDIEEYATTVKANYNIVG